MAEPTKPSHFVRTPSWKTSTPGASPAGGHPFPPEPNGYLHIGHARRSAWTSAWPRSWAGAATCASTTPTPPRRARSTWTHHADVHWLASTGPAPLLRERLLAGSTSGRSSSSARARRTWTISRPTNPRAPRHADEPGRESRWRNGRSTRTGTSSSACARRVRGREQGPAREDRHGHPNLNLRDPVMYRIRKTRTTGPATPGACTDVRLPTPVRLDRGVTHSLCTLEYEDHRPLYDWYLDRPRGLPPRQIEFARLSLSHTVMSKRKLLTLVQDGLVSAGTTAHADPGRPARPATPRVPARLSERIG